MPAFPIIDTHVRFWDPQRLPYARQEGNALLDRPYRIEDYRRDSQGLDTEALVSPECAAETGQSIPEIEFVEDEATRDSRIRAMVSRAPLERGRAVTPLLKEMVSRFLRVRGVRRIVQFDTDPAALLLSSSFVQGVKEFGLHFEMTVNYTQMNLVIEFVKHVPNVPIILDHCGKPGIRGGHIDPFQRQMAELARHSSVVCKLSGLATEADPAHWTSEDLQPVHRCDPERVRSDPCPVRR
jgi:L-fuconolactonase